MKDVISLACNLLGYVLLWHLTGKPDFLSWTTFWTIAAVMIIYVGDYVRLKF